MLALAGSQRRGTVEIAATAIADYVREHGATLPNDAVDRRNAHSGVSAGQMWRSPESLAR
jgi:hypothetical protein